MLLFQDISEDEDEKMWTPSQKAECILWYHEDRKPKNVQIKFRKKYGKNAKSRDPKSIKLWSEQFKDTGSCLRKKGKRTPTVDGGAIIKEVEENR